MRHNIEWRGVVSLLRAAGSVVEHHDGTDWVPTTTTSRPAGEDAVQLQGESHGHDYDTRGGFVADDGAGRLSWESPRHSGYRGALTVVEHAADSRVTARRRGRPSAGRALA